MNRVPDAEKVQIPSMESHEKREEKKRKRKRG